MNLPCKPMQNEPIRNTLKHELMHFTKIVSVHLKFSQAVTRVNIGCKATLFQRQMWPFIRHLLFYFFFLALVLLAGEGVFSKVVSPSDLPPLHS